MSEKQWGCLKSTAVGCAAAIVLAVALPIILAVMMLVPFQRAIDDRTALEERFGSQEAYVPPASGVPSSERIEAFLAVRRDLAGVYADIEAAEAEAAKLENLDHQDDVSAMQAVKQALTTSRKMIGVGPAIGRLFELRNAALLNAEMGLGEFSYLFFTAYHQQLVEPPKETQLFGPGPTNARVRSALRSMLQNQLGALRAAGGDSAEYADLETEIKALHADSARLPWQDGLPPEISAAYEPFRDQLDALYSPAAAPLELMINEKRGLAIESN